MLHNLKNCLRHTLAQVDQTSSSDLVIETNHFVESTEYKNEAGVLEECDTSSVDDVGYRQQSAEQTQHQIENTQKRLFSAHLRVLLHKIALAYLRKWPVYASLRIVDRS